MTPLVVPYVRIVEAPIAEPVTVEEAKEWCRIDSDDDSQLNVLNLCIAAARKRAEELTGRALVERQLELRLDSFPDGDGIIELPYPPLQHVDYIEYIDANGETVRIDAGSPEEWIEDEGSTPGRIQPLSGRSWPAAAVQVGAVRIGFTAGYAPGAGSPTDYAENIPPTIKAWMQARIATYYERRDQIDLVNLGALPRDFVDGLLDGDTVNRNFA